MRGGGSDGCSQKEGKINVQKSHVQMGIISALQNPQDSEGKILAQHDAHRFPADNLHLQIGKSILACAFLAWFRMGIFFPNMIRFPHGVIIRRNYPCITHAHPICGLLNTDRTAVSAVPAAAPATATRPHRNNALYRNQRGTVRLCNLHKSALQICSFTEFAHKHRHTCSRIAHPLPTLCRNVPCRGRRGVRVCLSEGKITCLRPPILCANSAQFKTTNCR